MLMLDTHIVVWLASGDHKILSPGAVEAINSAERLLYSPMVRLELQYLYEINRVLATPDTVLTSLGNSVGLQQAESHFDDVIRHALAVDWTRDVFDRMIVGNCMVLSLPLVSKDKKVRANYPRAIW